MRGRGKSPSESLTRPLSGMCGPLLGTKVSVQVVQADRRCSRRSQRGPRGGRVDRAQRSGASLNTATRGKPLRLGPRTPEDPRATGAPAPRRPSRGHRAGEGPPAPATGTCSDRGSKTRARRGAKRTEGSGRNRQRVRKRHRQRKWPGSHIYIYSNHTHERPSPLTPSGGRTRVCVRARGRVRLADFEAGCNRKTVTLFTE